MFCDKLNEYIGIVGCTGRALAKLFCISAPTINRYRSGERTSKPGSEDLRQPCRGICAADAHSAGVRRNILPAPPLYTMTDGLLPEMLKSRSVSEADSEKIRSFAQSQKNLMEEILKTNTVTDLIPQPTEEDFVAFPPTLFAPGIEAELAYTYAEYTAHLQATRDFAARQPNYFAEPFTENTFRNIRIVIHEGEWVMISKNKSPAIHFIIRHPTLRDAIERIEFPY